MRNAYALLGLAFLIVFGAAYILFDRAYAPTTDDTLSTSTTQTTMALTLSSPVFGDSDVIPTPYTCDGENMFPPLAIAGVPEEATTLVLVMDDPDIPAEVKQSQGIEKFDHYARYNIPADTATLEAANAVGEPGQNSSGETGYVSPCPPTQYEPTEHRYIFRLYALPSALSFDVTPTLDEIEAQAKEQAIAETQLTGRYTRVENASDGS